MSRGLEVRRYDGTNLGPGVPLAARGDDAQDHVTQDAAGRLHVHATSYDGATWLAGTVLIQPLRWGRAISLRAPNGAATRLTRDLLSERLAAAVPFE